MSFVAFVAVVMATTGLSASQSIAWQRADELGRCESIPRRFSLVQSGDFTLARGAIERARTIDAGENVETLRRELVAAADVCRSARQGRNRTYNDAAYVCLGDASLALAELARTDTSINREAALNEAWCAFSNANTLTNGASVDVQFGRARSADAMSALGVRASDFQREALTAYAAAANQGGTAVLHLAHAEALARAGQGANADLAFSRALAANPSSGDASRVLLGRLHAIPRTPEEKVRLLQSNASIGGPEIALETGRAFAAMAGESNAASARTNLLLVPRSSPAAYSEAQYLLSVLSAQSARSEADWRQASVYAEQAGGSEARYRWQACLVYVGLGDTRWSALDASDAPGPCAGGASAEDMLLRGMYHLRRAKYVPINVAVRDASGRVDTRGRDAWHRHLSAADEAFASGASALGTSTSRPFDLPGQDAGLDLGMLLRFGQDVVRTSRIGETCGLTAPDGAAKSFFRRYGVLGCRV